MKQEPLTMTSFPLPIKMKVALVKKAEQMECSQSELCRQALEEFLQR